MNAYVVILQKCLKMFAFSEAQPCFYVDPIVIRFLKMTHLEFVEIF